ncbi:hypothetical protein EVAR_42965_1 [Eumeta japonica]|uniref:Uncharacterized protein n=1 Tax=Eumeta variegata TaxID=151549 RepID=A0A4C1YEN9_EUMVA|nr:hypothetical protein EVAR_42965_1 [Eumeta japonica]
MVVIVIYLYDVVAYHVKGGSASVSFFDAAPSLLQTARSVFRINVSVQLDDFSTFGRERKFCNFNTSRRQHFKSPALAVLVRVDAAEDRRHRCHGNGPDRSLNVSSTTRGVSFELARIENLVESRAVNTEAGTFRFEADVLDQRADLF